MARPSDLWPEYKKLWYNDETGKILEPHLSNLRTQGISNEKIAEMEAIVQAEIKQFNLDNQEDELVNGETDWQRERRWAERRKKMSPEEAEARHNGTYDPDYNY